MFNLIFCHKSTQRNFSDFCSSIIFIDTPLRQEKPLKAGFEAKGIHEHVPLYAILLVSFWWCKLSQIGSKHQGKILWHFSVISFPDLSSLRWKTYWPVYEIEQDVQRRKQKKHAFVNPPSSCVYIDILLILPLLIIGHPYQGQLEHVNQNGSKDEEEVHQNPKGKSRYTYRNLKKKTKVTSTHS